MTRTSSGIFCLEGTWDRRLDNKKSVLPTLELLERAQGVPFIHRDVGTPEELFHYLSLWKQRGYAKYDVLYFAFHGEANGIQVGRTTVELETLAAQVDGRAAGRTAFFGCCRTLRLGADALDRFRRDTGLKAVSGYKKNVPWIESAAFELLVLSSLAGPGRIDARLNRLFRDYPDMTKRLGFTCYPDYRRATIA